VLAWARAPILDGLFFGSMSRRMHLRVACFEQALW